MVPGIKSHRTGPIMRHCEPNGVSTRDGLPWEAAQERQLRASTAWAHTPEGQRWHDRKRGDRGHFPAPLPQHQAAAVPPPPGCPTRATDTNSCTVPVCSI